MKRTFSVWSSSVMTGNGTPVVPMIASRRSDRVCSLNDMPAGIGTPYAAPSPDLVLTKQARRVQIYSLPSVCAACWRKRIACLRITTGRRNIGSGHTSCAPAHADDQR